MSDNVPRKLDSREMIESLQTPQPHPREPKVQLSNPLYDCIIHATFDLPPAWETWDEIGMLATAEQRIKLLRERVPELSAYDDVEIARLEVEASRAYAVALERFYRRQRAADADAPVVSGGMDLLFPLPRRPRRD